MDRIHRDEQTARHLLANDSGDLVLFVLRHQQSNSIRAIEYVLPRHTRLFTRHVGRSRRAKTNVSSL